MDRADGRFDGRFGRPVVMVEDEDVGGQTLEADDSG